MSDLGILLARSFEITVGIFIGVGSDKSWNNWPGIMAVIKDVDSRRLDTIFVGKLVRRL